MVKIDGKKIRDEVLRELKVPKDKFLAAIMVGENESSRIFLAAKKKTAEKIGLQFKIHNFPGTISKKELEVEIKKIISEAECGGVLVQLPMPSELDSDVLNLIPPEKDPDALGKESIAASPAVLVVEEIFEREGIIPEDKVIALLGQGFLTGKPVAKWLGNRPKELIVIDKNDDPSQLNRADIVISGVGKPKLFSAKQLKEGAGVIDFGEDFDPEGAEKLSFYTPTPGGVGPILIAMLFRNFCELNKREPR